MTRPFKGYIPTDGAYPLQGLNARVPSSMLAPQLSPSMSNLLVQEGYAKKREGYTGLGGTLEEGTVDTHTDRILQLVEFEDINSNKIFVCFTLSRIYRYDASGDMWVDITKQSTTGYVVTAVNTSLEKFSVGSDLTGILAVDDTFRLTGGASPNNKVWKVSAIVYGATTVITVDGDITDATVSGTIYPVVPFTGDADDYIDVTQALSTDGKWIVVTNGVEPPQFWDGSNDSFQDIDLTTYANFDNCNTMAVFFDHLFFGNVKDAGENPQLVAWSDTGDFQVWDVGNSGFTLLSDIQGAIIRLMPMGDLLVVYSTNGIQVISFTGGAQLFAVNNIMDGVNILSAGGIVDVFGTHFYLGQDNIYLFNGSSAPLAVGDAIADLLRIDLSITFSGRAFGFHDSIRHRVYWVIPTSETTSVVYIGEYIPTQLDTLTWSRQEFTDNISAMGVFSQVATGTWNSSSISGITWASKSGSWNDPSVRSGFPVLVLGSSVGVPYKNGDVLNDNGTSFDATWDTPDIPIPSEYLSVRGRYTELEFEALGDSVEILYSVNQGQTYSSVETVTLNSTFNRYRVLFDINDEFFRLQFKHSTDGPFQLRFWRVWATSGGVR